MSSDICGPITPTSLNGNRYFLTILDTATRFLSLSFLQDRKNLSQELERHIKQLRASQPHAPLILTTDNAKEYIGKDMKMMLASYGINHNAIPPYTPQQKSLAERINQTIMSTARATLRTSRLPPEYWEFAV